jgi:hypothetical protein
MIESEAVAKSISDLMVDCSARLNASTAYVRDNCTAEEFKIYRRAVGKVMGEILLEIMNPLYEKHPSLKPSELI